MHLVRPLLVVGLTTPLVLAGPRDYALNRRTGDDDTDKDSSSSTIRLSTGPTSPATLSSPLPASFIYGTGASTEPGSTVAILTTEVVYTTLTTCPVTSTVTSGTRSFEEVTTTISTVTRTSTSTICTKCVAPPKTKTESSPTVIGATASSTLPSFIVYSLTQPSTALSYVSSKPEIPGTGFTASPSKGLGFPSAISLTVSATLATSALIGTGYAIVASPTSTPRDQGPLSNATSSILPVFPPSLLGNGYGGGFVNTPSIYVTKLPFPNGPSEGVPPGYGFSSRPEIIATAPQSSGVLVGNSTPALAGLSSQSTTAFVVFTGLGLPSSTAFNVGNVTYEVSLPAATASNLSHLVPVLGGSSVSATTFTSQLAVSSGSLSTASAVIIEGSGFGFAVVGPQGSPSAPSGPETSTAAIATSTTVPSTGSSGETLLSHSVSVMPIGMSANGAPIFASSSASVAVVMAASQVTGAPNPEIAPTATAPVVEASQTSSEYLSNVPAILFTRIATSGEIIVETSSPPPVIISSTASNFELIITTSTPSPVLVSQTASGGQVFVETSTPPAVFITSAEAPAASLAIGSPIAIGVVGSPTLSSGQAAGVPITLAATSTSEEQSSGSGQFAATVLTTVVGVNGLTSLAIIAPSSEQTSLLGQGIAITPSTALGANGVTSLATVAPSPEQTSSVEYAIAITPSPSVGANAVTSSAIVASPPNQPIATILTPVVGANGLTSLAVVAPSANQPVSTTLMPVIGANGITSFAVTPTPVEQFASIQPSATVLTPVVGFNGLTSLAFIPTPVVGANGLTSLAVFSTPVAAANGIVSPAVLLTPVVGANGLTSLAVLATPVVGANGLTSLAVGLQGQQGSSGTPSPIEETIPAPITPTPPIFGPGPILGPLLSSAFSTPSMGTGGNSSVHMPLNPSTVAQFEGSAAKLSMCIGTGLVSFVVFLLLL